METKAHHVLIGAFILLTALAALLFGAWVAKVSFDAEFTEYDVLFNDPVTGLGKGALVNFNGIQVGEVRRLRLDAADPTRVLARIRVDAATPVKADTSARLTYTGLTGVVVIELVVGKADAAPLAVPPDAEVGVILAQPSALQELMSEGGNVLVRLTEALDRVSKVLSEENAQSFTATLAHIESITAQVDADKADLGKLLRRADVAFAKIDGAADDFVATVAAADQTLVRIDRVLDHDIAPAAQDFGKAIAALNQITGRIDGLLSRNSGHIDAFAENGLADLSAVLSDMRTLVAHLNNVSGRFEAAPADYLLQRDQPREYQGK